MTDIMHIPPDLRDEPEPPTMAGASGLLFDTTPEGRANRAAVRALGDEQARSSRLRAAVEALDRCGLGVWGATLQGTGSARFEVARAHVQALRASLRDGSDEPRYAATGAALAALGALWAVSQ